MTELNFATQFQHKADLLNVPAGLPLFKEGDDPNDESMGSDKIYFVAMSYDYCSLRDRPFSI